MKRGRERERKGGRERESKGDKMISATPPPPPSGCRSPAALWGGRVGARELCGVEC